MQKSLRHNSRRAGLTLIELVIVLVIVAALAGLAVPLVSMLARSSNMATSASNQREVANNIELFFALQKRYPQGMDSLIVSGGTALYAPMQSDGSTAATLESHQATGLPVSGPSLYKDLEVVDITGNELRSLQRCGFDFVYDHLHTTTNSNESGTELRDLVGVATSANFKVASVKMGTTPGVIFSKLVGQGLPVGATRIVALGFGQKNSAIGKTVTLAPIYPGCDGKYYGRFVAFFMLYANGERASLVGVSDSYGRTPDYTQQQFNESLPNGSRQD